MGVVHAGCHTPQAVQSGVRTVQEGINVETAPSEGGPAGLEGPVGKEGDGGAWSGWREESTKMRCIV